MPRNMSFALTTDQVRNRTKTVTRRKGWKFLKAGDVVNGCVKCMGLKPGEKVEQLATIRILEVRQERLDSMVEEPYGSEEAAKEGFPEKSGVEFALMFASHMGGEIDQVVTRIEFEYVE